MNVITSIITIAIAIMIIFTITTTITITISITMEARKGFARAWEHEFKSDMGACNGSGK